MIRTRAEWGAQAQLRTDPNTGRVVFMRLPAAGLWLHHSVTRPTGNENADFRVIERIGVQRFGILSYSFLCHPEGVLAEGAGLSVGAHTGGRNSTTFGLCFVGNYDTLDLTEGQLAAAQWLYWHLRDEGHLVPDAFVGMHRDVRSTSCPGNRTAARFPAIRARILTRPGPTPPPPPPPPPPQEGYAMDTLNLRDAHLSPVRGRHVDNLQGLLVAASTWEPMAPCHPGAVDGIAGSSTRSALGEFQSRAKYLGIYDGPADLVVGPATWRALIEF